MTSPMPMLKPRFIRKYEVILSWTQRESAARYPPKLNNNHNNDNNSRVSSAGSNKCGDSRKARIG